MKTIRTLTDEAIHSQLQNLTAEERKITIEIIHYLREVERRRLYANQGYSSLFEYTVKALGYSESSAYRRISAMRAVRETPELATHIENGQIHVSAIAQVQTFFNQFPSRTLEEKNKIYSQIAGKSKRETERVLAELSPQPRPRPQSARPLASGQTELRITVDQPVLDKLHKLQDLLSSRMHDSRSYAELLDLLAELALKKVDPSTQRSRSPSSKPKAADQNLRPILRTRYISSVLRRAVWKRDQGRCTYVSADGRACSNRQRLQVDHRIPFSAGGSSTDLKNLRLLCPAHNQWEAIRHFGGEKIAPYLKNSIDS